MNLIKIRFFQELKKGEGNVHTGSYLTKLVFSNDYQTIVALICTVRKAIFRYIFSKFIVFFYELRLRRLKAIALKFFSRGSRHVQFFLLPQNFVATQLIGFYGHFV